jgi:hypothetical protein
MRSCMAESPSGFMGGLVWLHPARAARGGSLVLAENGGRYRILHGTPGTGRRYASHTIPSGGSGQY